MQENQSFNIVIIAEYPFPVGIAPTNRILAYSRGLIQSGANVDVVIPIPTDKKKRKDR